MSSVHTVQTVMSQLDPSQMSVTVLFNKTKPEGAEAYPE